LKVFLYCIILFSSLIGLETSDRLFDCTEVFKERKSELLIELERIDEQKQALSALQAATEELLQKKEISLIQQEEKIQEQLQQISQKEQNIKVMLEQNQKVLAELKSTKMDSIAQTYAKMKAAAASNILSDMGEEEAAKILSSLKPKTVGKILTKMDPKKASKLTLLLTK